MPSSWRVYVQAFNATLQTKLEYRADLCVGVITAVMMQAASLSLLWIVLRAVPSLAGWSAPEVLFLFGMTAACLGGSELFFNHIWLLPQAILQGDLDRLLTYPVRSLPFYLVTRPELHAIGNLTTGAAYVVTALTWRGAAWYSWLAVPPLWLCGMLIYTSVLVCLGCLSFRFLGPWSYALMLGHNLAQATRYPLAAYPRPVETALLVIVPYGTFNYLPASVLFGKGTPIAALLAAPVAALLMVALAERAWSWGLARYESTGS
jgi:ABC-2 type transport system permease protein